MTTEESLESLNRAVEEARYAAIIGADHSWRCRYEPDPGHPDKERPCDVREDTCCCGAVQEVDVLIAAVDARARAARAALATSSTEATDYWCGHDAHVPGDCPWAPAPAQEGDSE